VLPPALVARLAWNTLELEPGSFIDARLRDRHSDLLYRVDLAAGGEAFVYVLFEHQSRPDPLMAWRLLLYMCRIWERWVGESREARQLPPIVPVVLYHGEEPWTAPLHFAELLEPGAREALGDLALDFVYALDDLGRVADQALCSREMAVTARLVALLLKHGRRPGFLARMAAWADLFRQVRAELGPDETIVAFTYILNLSPEHDIEEIESVFADPAVKEAIVTAAEKLIEKGRREGLEQGLQQGLQQGQAAMILSQLRRRFGDVPRELIGRVESSEPAALERIAERLLEAATLSDVFAGED
jgi:predicted transposase/invertase (TIGR01784 family)